MTVLPQSDPNEQISPEEYLRREREASFRSEYLGGRIVAMSGGTGEHSLIAVNLVTLLRTALRGGACLVYNSDLKVRLPKTLRYVYPDATVVCGGTIYQDEHRDVVTNPTMIVEVLSSSTEAYDRGEKWEHYQQLPSLQEYVLVAQTHAAVARFVRHGDLWLYSLTAGVDASVTFESVGVTLALADIYADVALSVDAPSADSAGRGEER